MTRVFLALMALPLLISCSNSDASGPARPAARPEMTKQATHALSSVQKLFELKSASSKTSPRPFPRHIAWQALEPVFPGHPPTDGVGSTPAKGGDGLRLNADDSARRLDQVLSPNDCIFDLPIDKDPGTAKDPGNGAPSMDIDIPNLNASIGGPNCPLEARMEVQGTKSGSQIRATLLISFVAKTPAMQQELRAKNVRLTGAISGNVVQSSDQSVNADLRGNITGQGELLTGEQFTSAIGFGMKMSVILPDQNARPAPTKPGGPDFGSLPLDFFTMEMSQSHRYDFGDSLTTLAMNASMKGFSDFKESYLINGRSATRAEFEEYASQINLPGMPQPGSDEHTNPGPMPSDRPMMCTLQAFDARETSLRSLEDALSSGVAVRGFPLRTLHSCQDNTNAQLNEPAIGEVRMSIRHDFDYVQADVTVNGQPYPLFMQREFPNSLAAQNGGATFLFQCHPVVKCGP